MTLGFGRLRPEPKLPSRHCKRARTGLAQRTAVLDRAQMTPTPRSGPLTNATVSLTSVTGPPTNASEPPAETISRGWRW
jgi:hypothetical protein